MIDLENPNLQQIRERIAEFTDPITRWTHRDNFDQIPILESELDIALSTADQTTSRKILAANQHWRIAGTNASSASDRIILEIGGGLELLCGLAANDQMILRPRTLNSGGTPASGLENARFNFAAEPYMCFAAQLGYSGAYDPTVNVFHFGFRNVVGSFGEANALDHAMLCYDPAVHREFFRLSTRSLATTRGDVRGHEARHKPNHPDGATSTVRFFEILVKGLRAHAWIDGVYMGESPDLVSQSGFHLKPQLGIQRLRTDGAHGAASLFPKWCILSLNSRATI